MTTQYRHLLGNACDALSQKHQSQIEFSSVSECQWSDPTGPCKPVVRLVYIFYQGHELMHDLLVSKIRVLGSDGLMYPTRASSYSRGVFVIPKSSLLNKDPVVDRPLYFAC
jgi:hypothetical protein